MTKVAVVILAAVCAVGCTSAPDKTTVLKYDDFGPQAAAYETIGMRWWQWDTVGDCDSNCDYDIKVVVYRDIPLRQVREAYPVVKEKEQDYRYLSYAKAIAHLDAQIRAGITPEVTEVLRKTKSRIEEEMGKPDD